MKLENVLKIMAAVTAMFVAFSEVLNQANQYNKAKHAIDNAATNSNSSPATED